MQLRNAKIESTMLGFEDHGILTAYLYLDYGGSGQSFGGPHLGPTVSHLESDSGFGITWIATVLDVVGVDKWDQLNGKNIRVIHEHDNVHAIGNIIENKWYCPAKETPQEVKRIIEELDRII